MWVFTLTDIEQILLFSQWVAKFKVDHDSMPPINWVQAFMAEPFNKFASDQSVNVMVPRINHTYCSFTNSMGKEPKPAYHALNTSHKMFIRGEPTPSTSISVLGSNIGLTFIRLVHQDTNQSYLTFEGTLSKKTVLGKVLGCWYLPENGCTTKSQLSGSPKPWRDTGMPKSSCSLFYSMPLLEEQPQHLSRTLNTQDSIWHGWHVTNVMRYRGVRTAFPVLSFKPSNQ